MGPCSVYATTALLSVMNRGVLGLFSRSLWVRRSDAVSRIRDPSAVALRLHPHAAPMNGKSENADRFGAFSGFPSIMNGNSKRTDFPVAFSDFPFIRTLPGGGRGTDTANDSARQWIEPHPDGRLRSMTCGDRPGPCPMQVHSRTRMIPTIMG